MNYFSVYNLLCPPLGLARSKSSVNFSWVNERMNDYFAVTLWLHLNPRLSVGSLLILIYY